MNFHARHVVQKVNVLKNMILKIFTQILREEVNVMKDNSSLKIMVNVFLVEMLVQIAINMGFV